MIEDKTEFLSGRQKPFTEQRRLAEIILYRNGVQEQIYPLFKDQTTIGTAPDNDMVISDRYVSRHHCIIENRRGLFFLIDSESRNGTYLNQTFIKETALNDKHYIEIGKTLLQFQYRNPIAIEEHTFEGMISKSPLMKNVFQMIERTAKASSTIIIYGETGTGKELIAKALHSRSLRKRHPFLAINCGAIPESLIESELFGHVKGAFTGAAQDRPGAFLAAQNGTLFLDEIGELPLSMQPKLLRVLECRDIKPLGSERSRKVDVRIIAATHRDLSARVREGTFREDLFYRLHLIPIYVPPLRDRKEDIPLLIEYFLSNTKITNRALNILTQQKWPGNVRELKNVLERIQLSIDTPLITEREVRQLNHIGGLPLQETIVQTEKNILLDYLHKHHWNKSATARALSMPKTTLLGKIKKFQLKKEVENSTQN